MPAQITVLTPSDLADHYTAGEVDALLKSRKQKALCVSDDMEQRHPIMSGKQ